VKIAQEETSDADDVDDINDPDFPLSKLVKASKKKRKLKPSKRDRADAQREEKVKKSYYVSKKDAREAVKIYPADHWSFNRAQLRDIDLLSSTIRKTFGQSRWKDKNYKPWPMQDIKGEGVFQGLFWYPTVKASDDPEQYMRTKLAVWIPELQFGNDPHFNHHPLPTCPVCNSPNDVVTNGYSPGTKVCGLDYTYPLICRRYVCEGCKVAKRPYNFVSVAPEVVSQLPTHIANLFDFVGNFKVGNASIFERSVVDVMLKWIRGGNSSDAFQAMMVQQHRQTHLKMAARYYNYIMHLKELKLMHTVPVTPFPAYERNQACKQCPSRLSFGELLNNETLRPDDLEVHIKATVDRIWHYDFANTSNNPMVSSDVNPMIAYDDCMKCLIFNPEAMTGRKRSRSNREQRMLPHQIMQQMQPNEG
jgi:hypothetical protein